MPDSLESAQFAKPFVYESLRSKALHFSLGEIQSRMQLQDPSALDLEYTQTMMAFLMFEPEPTAIAMIGLGGGSLPKFCYRYLPGTHIRVIEINPHVIALRDAFHVPRDNKRFSIVHTDGAYFVRYARTVSMSCWLMDSTSMACRQVCRRSASMTTACNCCCRAGSSSPTCITATLTTRCTLIASAAASISRCWLSITANRRTALSSLARAVRCTHSGAARSGRPKNLAPAATAQLLAAFARIDSAMRDQRA